MDLGSLNIPLGGVCVVVLLVWAPQMGHDVWVHVLGVGVRCVQLCGTLFEFEVK